MIPAEGSIVWMYECEFYAENVVVEPTADGTGSQVRFDGRCTLSRMNNRLRDTKYDGARYGWRIEESGDRTPIFCEPKAT